MRKHPAPRDPGLIDIDNWERWFLGAQLATITANPDMHDGERATAITGAKALAAAVGEQMRSDYLTWQNRIV